MTEEKKNHILSKYMKGSWTYFCVIAFLMFVFFIGGQYLLPDERDAVSSDYSEFKAQWYQLKDNGEKVPVEVPGKVEAERGEVVTFVTILPTDVYSGECLCFRSVWQDVDIYVDGALRESYNTKDSRLYGTNSAFRYIFLELDESDAGKELTYKFSSDSKYAGVTRMVRRGEKTAILVNLVKEAGLRTGIAVFLMLMSLFCIVVCAILKYVYKKNLPLRYLAWTIFFCALWMLSEIEFRQILFKNVSVLTNYTYWSLMIISIPLLSYMNETQDGRYAKLYSIPMAYSMGIFVVGTILQVFDVVQFVTQLPFIHASTFVSLAVLIGTITVDVFKKRIKDYVAVGIGIYGLLFTAILEIILYYIGTSLSLGTVLAVGLLFLLVMAIIKTGQDLARTERAKQKAVMAKEAQAQFLANMSHEIRTPINVVVGMNEMILREAEKESVKDYAHNIQNASNMLLGLVNDVLDFSKIESGQLELVEDTYDLASLLKDEMLMLNARAKGKTIATKMVVDPGIPVRLYGDELRIKQVLTNLISNAVKYTKEGNITIRVFFNWIDDEKIALCFSVIDTGMGIKKEDLSRLFDSFMRLEVEKNRNVEGTGLGLNIVKKLTDLMEGNIAVDSEYGKGSTFTVSIPQKVVDEEPIGNFEAALKAGRKTMKSLEKSFTAPDANILVVDDNSMNLALMKGLLKRTQINVDLASGGKECLELTKSKIYNIILMDHMMPELDGIETLNMLRSDSDNPNKETKVIALTANAIAGCREMYLGFGFNDYVSKPIQADKLDALLLQYLPRNLVYIEGEFGMEEKKNLSWPKELLNIDRATGLSYCMESEELYKEMLQAFCEQVREYKPQLETYFTNEDWEQYAIVAHALKGNALNIGAVEFSGLSKKHEFAGKECNKAFIQKEYPIYVNVLDELVEKIEKM